MKTIVVINDNSKEALHAAILAFNIAEKVGANLLISNEVKRDEPIVVEAKMLANQTRESGHSEEPVYDLSEHLKGLYDADAVFIPEVMEMDISDFTEEELSRFVISHNIWMMVAGAHELSVKGIAGPYINLQSVLNRVMCPLLLVPEKSHFNAFQQIVYIADLRYCRLQIVKYLAELALPYHANVLIDHISAKGLPDMEENYALRVFNEEVLEKVNYNQLLFNNIKERDLTKAVDVMIDGMDADLLVIVNHRFHFEEILGRYITNTLPAYVTIPLLIFPC